MYLVVVIFSLIYVTLCLDTSTPYKTVESYRPLLHPPDKPWSPKFDYETCKENESWKTCLSSCPSTCDSPYGDRNCVEKVCVSGCECTFPFVRDGNDCIDFDECAVRREAKKSLKQRQLDLEHQCGPHSEWNECGSACPYSCENRYDGPIDCASVCVPRCVCTDGYMLHHTGACVSLDQCEIEEFQKSFWETLQNLTETKF